MFTYINLIASTLITVILTFVIRKFLEKRSPLIFSYLTTTTGKIALPKAENPCSVPINTHTLIISNPYNHLIKDVHVINYLPPQLITEGIKSIADIITLFPVIDYEIKKSQNVGSVEEIIFPKLLPKQSIIITYMYNITVNFKEFNISATSDEGIAKLVPYVPQQIFPKWLSILLWVLIGIGSIVTINFIINIIPVINMLLHLVNCH